MRIIKMEVLSLCCNVINMIVLFEEKYLQELYETGKTADKKTALSTRNNTKIPILHPVSA